MFGNLWSRIKALVARAFRREPTPGRFESGSKFSMHGIVGTAPLVWPSRDYLVYIPKGRSIWRRAPLLSCATAASRHRKRSRKGRA